MDRVFKYTELPSASAIRLLKVDLMHDGETLHGTLITTDIHGLKYACLSYTWGTPYLFEKNDFGDPSRWDEKSAFKLTDSSTGTSGVIPIARNLYEFLIHMDRNPPEAVAYIWIDAICINQRDLAERASQVLLMGEVYKSCEQTIVWLGPEDRDTERVMHILEAVSRLRDSDAFGGSFFRMEPRISYLRTIESLDDTNLGEQTWGALGRFFERSWFHRAWTVQESVLPEKVFFICGRFSTDLLSIEQIANIVYFKDTLERSTLYLSLASSMEDRRGVFSRDSFFAICFFTTTHRSLRNELFNLDKWRASFWNGKPRHPVWFRGKLCSDLRDHVYASLGLLDQQSFPIDYTKPVEDVFRESCIELGITDALLFSKEYPTETRLHSLPSWVPDLSSKPVGPDWESMYGYHYMAGGRGQLEYELVEDSKVLRVRAFEVDAIRDIGGSSLDMWTGATLMQSLTLLDDSRWTSVGEHTISEAFWRTLIANILTPYPSDEFIGSSFQSFCLYYLAQYLRSNSDAGAWADVLNLLNSLHRRAEMSWIPCADEVAELSKVIEEDDHETVDLVVDEMRMYTRALEKIFVDRVFFTTRNGRMGTGHMALKGGSRIFVVKGCRCPLVLREGSEGRYRLTGAVYVHGIMYGEAIDWGRFEDIEIE